MIRRSSEFLKEHIVVALLFPIVFSLMWYQRGLSDALWIAGSLVMIVAQIAVVVYTLVYVVYRETPRIWYLPTVGILFAYSGYLLYLELTRQLIIHSILTVGPGFLFFGLVAKNRRAQRG